MSACPSPLKAVILLTIRSCDVRLHPVQTIQPRVRDTVCVYAARVHIFVQIIPVATHARFQLYSKSFVKHKNCCSLTEWSESDQWCGHPVQSACQH